MRLVEEGKLSADDAMDLVEAIQGGGSVPPPVPPEAQAWDRAETTPPPTPEEPAKEEGEKDPLRAAMDAIEKLGRDISSSVNWKDVSDQIRSGAKRGFEAIRDAARDISEGKINLSFLGTVATRTQELPLAFDASKTLRIDNSAGMVKVMGGSPLGKVSATAQIQAATQEEADNRAEGFLLMIEESEQFVDIKLPQIQGMVADLTIHLSHDANLELKTRSGNVVVEQINGNVRVNGASGDVKVTNTSGVVEISTASGDVSLERVTSPSISIEDKSGNISVVESSGSLNARSASGDVVVEAFSGRVVAIEAVSGDVKVGLQNAFDGTMTLRTVSGDTVLNLADGNSARVTLSTLSGTVKSDLELGDRTDQEKRVTGTLGEGVGSIDISAVAGDISVSQVKAASVV
ncbi:MAG: DUF4097 family beta strand repeat protein [Chthonomonas sp.]|nr:DUF4097 family beta strand repeat protein [Chthonomonas sp.]